MKQLKIKCPHGISLAKGMYLLVISTLLSYFIIFLINIIGMEVVLNLLYPVDIRIPFPYNLCGLLLIVLGLMLNIWANFTLLGKISLTEREPFHTPSALVVGGPYRFSRNPVYLSVLFLCLGAAILFGSLTLFIILIALFIIFQLWFIGWEEKKLEEVFGEEYVKYKKRVRRWF